MQTASGPNPGPISQQFVTVQGLPLHVAQRLASRPPVDSRRLSLAEAPRVSRHNSSRNRYSVGDVQFLLRNGYAANPEHLSHGSRYRVSVSLPDHLAGKLSAVNLDQDDDDSGLGDDPWLQYKSIIQQKKHLVFQEHTSWVNGVLKLRKCQPILDLCRSMGDGLTLINLAEILTNERIDIPFTKPFESNQKAENLQHCLRHLESSGVDTHGITGAELVNGNLKSTLILMNNLRKRFEKPQPLQGQHPSPVNRAQTPHQSTATTPPVYTTSTVTTSPAYTSTPSHHPGTQPGTRSLQSAPLPGGDYQISSDLLPGVLPVERTELKAPVNHPPHMMKTELNGDQVIQHGSSNRHLMHSTPITATSPWSGSALSVRATGGGKPPPYPHVAPGVTNYQSPPPTVAPQAWVNGVTKSNVNQSSPPVVNAQQRQAMDAQMRNQSKLARASPRPPTRQNTTGIINTAYDPHGEDGELIVPPPRPRDNYPAETTQYAYKPSLPSDKPSGPWASHQQHSTAPGVTNQHTNSGTALPSYHHPPQYNRPGKQPAGPETPQYSRPYANQEVNNQYNQPPVGRNTWQYTPPNSGSSVPIPYSIPPGVTVAPVNLGPISNGRTSPQGQSSTPVSQSPNHDKISPSPTSWNHNYVNISSKENLYKISSQNAQEGRRTPIYAVPEGRKTPVLGQDGRRTPLHLAQDGRKTPVPGVEPPKQEPNNNMPPAGSQGQSAMVVRSRNNAIPLSMYARIENSPHVRREPSPLGRRESIPREHWDNVQSNANQYSRQQTIDGKQPRVQSPVPDQLRQSPHNNLRQEEEIYSSVKKDHLSGKSPRNTNDKRTVISQYERDRIEIHSSPTIKRPELALAMDKANSKRVTSPVLWNEAPRGQVRSDKWRGTSPKPTADDWTDSDDSCATPPLPPLSPSNTPPITPQHSSRPLHTKPTNTRLPPDWRPDQLEPSRRPGTRKKPGKRMEGSWRRTQAGRAAYRVGSYSASRNTPGLIGQTTQSLDLDSMDQGSVTNGNISDEWETQNQDMTQIQRQMEGLEGMYTEILKVLGLDKEYLPGSRRSISSMSSTSRTGGSRKARNHTYAHRTARELRQVNKRFNRLESHVVTLARSVAHLSSEMRSQNAMYQEIEDLKKEIQEIREDRATHATAAPLLANEGGTGTNGRPLHEFEKFRGWIPAITNPKRVRKLAKFFGQDHLLHYFLEKLGYQKYIKNFEAEEITIIELPYMSEERLEKLGIPMGPRQRILQEAQLSFRQENFNIYIV